MNTISFSSVLSSAYYNELETLMFFNPQQGKFRTAIIDSVEHYGKPRIITDGNLLRIGIGAFLPVQALFALDEQKMSNRLLGVIAYIRDVERIAILHIAVRKEYSVFGIRAEELLAMRLINKVREIASRIKGVRFLTIVYKEGSIGKIPVQPNF